MAKEIDRVRAQSALAVIKQHPGMVLFAVSPVIIALAAVWWLFGAGWAALLLVGIVLSEQSHGPDEARLAADNFKHFAVSKSHSHSDLHSVVIL